MNSDGTVGAELPVSVRICCWPRSRCCPNGRSRRCGLPPRATRGSVICCSRAAATTSSPSRPAGRAWPGPDSSAWAGLAAPIAGNMAESRTSAGRWDEAVEILDEVLSLDLAPLGRFAAGNPRPYRRSPRRAGNGRTDRSRNCIRCGRPTDESQQPASARPDRDRGPAGPGRPRGRPGRRANGPDPLTGRPIRGTCGRCSPRPCAPAPRQRGEPAARSR